MGTSVQTVVKCNSLFESNVGTFLLIIMIINIFFFKFFGKLFKSLCIAFNVQGISTELSKVYLDLGNSDSKVCNTTRITS